MVVVVVTAVQHAVSGAAGNVCGAPVCDVTAMFVRVCVSAVVDPLQRYSVSERATAETCAAWWPFGCCPIDVAGRLRYA